MTSEPKRRDSMQWWATSVIAAELDRGFAAKLTKETIATLAEGHGTPPREVSLADFLTMGRSVAWKQQSKMYAMLNDIYRIATKHALTWRDLDAAV